MRVPASDKLAVLEIFNARIGREFGIWNELLELHGVGSCKHNGHLLLSYCSEQELYVTGAGFQLPARHKTTWQHPMLKYQLDHVLVRRQDHSGVQITRAMPSADDCWTDHRLVV